MSNFSPNKAQRLKNKTKKMENEFERKLSSENQKEQIVLNDDYINEIISGLVDFAKGREAKMKTYSERYGIKKKN